MISYSRDPHETIPSSAVKIVGLGGAGANMLERIALDSIEGAELLALNTDIRTLGACLAKEKIQLGVNLTKGLGTGGDPELGQQAMLEAENKVREALKGQQIVFLCAGLGGGTGSGAAPIVARIAREEGAFVVVFATMPFFFEGRRRRDQAETSLNQLAVLSNALVTFDNNRMGELVLAKQGIHEAFAAADKMISESIKAVIRLVVRPGLINVGLDDLMSALRTTRSRCLFGSGLAEGKDRASKALRNALSSPLLDQGSLLKDAQTVLVHLSGGESLTLFEIELLMQNLQKHVPEKAHVLFGAAIDPNMGDTLSITLISALPEDALTGGTRDSISPISKTIAQLDSETQDTEAHTSKIENPFTKIDKVSDYLGDNSETDETSEQSEKWDTDEDLNASDEEITSDSDQSKSTCATKSPELTHRFDDEVGNEETPQSSPSTAVEMTSLGAAEEKEDQEERPFAEPDITKIEKSSSDPKTDSQDESTAEAAKGENHEEPDDSEKAPSRFASATKPKTRPVGKQIWGKKDDSETESKLDDPFESDLADEKSSTTQLKLDSKQPGSQSELSFDNAPRGRFEGENPNVFEGEDLDLPPFLRKKKS